MNKKNQGYRIYFVLMLFLLGFAIILSFLQKQKTYYTKDQLFKDIDAGSVTEIVIEPNAENGTGALSVKFENGL